MELKEIFALLVLTALLALQLTLNAQSVLTTLIPEPLLKVIVLFVMLVKNAYRVALLPLQQLVQQVTIVLKIHLS
jgi:hypothetical protein